MVLLVLAPCRTLSRGRALRHTFPLDRGSAEPRVEAGVVEATGVKR